MYLLDTNILIYALKSNPSVLVQLKRHKQHLMAVAIISLMELYYGAYKSERVASNLAKVRQIENAFPILKLGPEAATTFGNLKAHLELDGMRLDDFDLAIAASALAHNLTLVTNNEKHFARIEGLRLENWVSMEVE